VSFLGFHWFLPSSLLLLNYSFFFFQPHRAHTEIPWVPGPSSRHSLVLGRLARLPHLLMLVSPLQDGTSCLFLMALHPLIPSGCVLAETQRSLVTGLLFLALHRQGSSTPDYIYLFFIRDLYSLLGILGWKLYIHTLWTLSGNNRVQYLLILGISVTTFRSFVFYFFYLPNTQKISRFLCQSS